MCLYPVFYVERPSFLCCNPTSFLSSSLGRRPLFFPENLAPPFFPLMTAGRLCPPPPISFQPHITSLFLFWSCSFSPCDGVLSGLNRHDPPGFWALFPIDPLPSPPGIFFSPLVLFMLRRARLGAFFFRLSPLFNPFESGC